MGGKQSSLDWAPTMAAMCAPTGEDPGDKTWPKDYPRGAVSIGKKVAAGKFGAVAMATLKDYDGSSGGKAVSACCKKIKGKAVPREAQARMLLGVAQMAQVSSPHVVSLLGVVASSSSSSSSSSPSSPPSSADGGGALLPTLLLLEWCDGGNLADFLAHAIGMGTAHKLKILADVADGLCELEALGIVHGSVSCKNVLVAGGGTVFKVGDWGRVSGDVTHLPHEMLRAARAQGERKQRGGKAGRSGKQSRASTASSSSSSSSASSASSSSSAFAASSGSASQDDRRRSSGGSAGGADAVDAAIAAGAPTHAADAFAFGVLAQEVFADGQRAYPPGWDDTAVVAKVLDEGHRPPRLDTCPAEIYRIMEQCWSEDPGSRPDFFWLRGELEDRAAEAKDRHNRLSRISMLGDVVG